MNWLRYIWQRVRCFFGRHELEASLEWNPKYSCLIVGCDFCGLAIFHHHFGDLRAKGDPKHPGESRVH